MMMMSVEQSVEWVAGETEVFGENRPFLHHKYHMITWPDLTWHRTLDLSGGKHATNRLSYGTVKEGGYSNSGEGGHNPDTNQSGPFGKVNWKDAKKVAIIRSPILIVIGVTRIPARINWPYRHFSLKIVVAYLTETWILSMSQPR
jgi:hypothetical protein